MVVGLFSLLFYCESGINQYIVQKTLTDVFWASLLLIEPGCHRYVVLLYHLRILLVFMRINKSFVLGAECETYLSCYNLFLQFLYYRRKNKRLRETVVSMLFWGALEKSLQSTYRIDCGILCSKNQKGIFAMWVWLERKSCNRAEAMEKSISEMIAEFVFMCMRERKK